MNYAKKQSKHGHCCAFAGRALARNAALNDGCDAAAGADKALFVYCPRCVGGQALYICLDCWARLAERARTEVHERRKRFALLNHPAYTALLGTDWLRLRSAAGTAGWQARRPSPPLRAR